MLKKGINFQSVKKTVNFFLSLFSYYYDVKIASNDYSHIKIDFKPGSVSL